MLTHATYKSTMFFAAGNLEAAAGGTGLEALEGFGRRLPLTGLGFLFAFTAAISLPPTGGFMAKELIFEGLIERHHFVVFAALWIGAVLLMAVFCKIVAVLWARREATPRAEAPAGQVFPVLVLGLLAMVTGAVFTSAAPTVGALFAEPDAGWLIRVWHFSPLTVASFAHLPAGRPALLRRPRSGASGRRRRSPPWASRRCWGRRCRWPPRRSSTPTRSASRSSTGSPTWSSATSTA